MIQFKVLNLRRRLANMRGQIPGVPSQVQMLEGIELILDYIPDATTGISTIEEQKVVNFINNKIQETKGNPFIILYNNETLVTPTQKGESVENNDEKTLLKQVKSETSGEAEKWKAKYDEVISKNRGLVLKCNEYKKKLINAGIIKDESTTQTQGGAKAESRTTAKAGGGKGKA